MVSLLMERIFRLTPNGLTAHTEWLLGVRLSWHLACAGSALPGMQLSISVTPVQYILRVGGCPVVQEQIQRLKKGGRGGHTYKVAIGVPRIVHSCLCIYNSVLGCSGRIFLSGRDWLYSCIFAIGKCWSAKQPSILGSSGPWSSGPRVPGSSGPRVHCL